MAGRSAADAIRNYKSDLELAFGCLEGFAKIEFAAPRHRTGAECSWILTGPGDFDGVELPEFGGRFEASQRLRIVECDPREYGGRIRLTTTAYDYSLSGANGRELWSMHWHPNAPNSAVTYPHIHLRPQFGRAHLATSRLLVEHAIHWAIECGAPAHFDDWRNRLQHTISRHRAERGWS